MKPDLRAHFLTLAFTPKTRTTDRRAEWYGKVFESITREIHPQELPPPSRPLWPLALSALIWWSLVIAAVWYLARSYGWSA